MLQIKSLNKSFRILNREAPLLKRILAPEYMYKKAISDISMEIERGEIIGILGKNGAGKSTFIKLLSLLQRPTSGEILWNNIPIHKQKREFYKKISVIFGHKTGLWWDLPLKDSLNAAQKIYGIHKEDFKKNKRYLTEALSLCALLDRPVRELSLGERVKAEICFNMLHDPQLILLDEPSIGLDIFAKKELRYFLKHIVKEKQCTIILTSHDIKDIESCCSSVCVIQEGHLIFKGSIPELHKKVTKQEKIVMKPTFTLWTKDIIASFTKKLGRIEEINSVHFSESTQELIIEIKRGIDSQGIIPLLYERWDFPEHFFLSYMDIPLEDILLDFL